MRHLLVVAGVVGVLWFVPAVSRDAVVGFLVALAAAELVTLLRDTPELDQRYVSGGIGVAVVVGSLFLGYSAVDGTGALWLPILLLTFGGWLLTDTAAAFVRGRPPDAGESPTLSSVDVMLLTTHGHLVASELESGPRTRTQLAAACDLTESRVDEALGYLTDAGVVSADGDQYVLNEDRTGATAFVRRLVVGAVSRAVRPFRVLL